MKRGWGGGEKVILFYVRRGETIMRKEGEGGGSGKGIYEDVGSLVKEELQKKIR